MKKTGLILCSLILIALPLSAEPKNFVLVYTSSLNGYMDYCTCKADPKGGLVKRGTALKHIREKYKDKDIILVDSGDILPVYTADLLPPYIFNAYKYLSYDALAFGDQDLDFGIDSFLSLSGTLPFVSTNAAFTKKDAEKIPQYRIIRKKGITAAIIAVQNNKSYKYSREETISGINISDPLVSIQAAMKDIEKEKPDIVILLSHCGYDIDRIMAGKLSGIPIIVGGHSQTIIETPSAENGIYILQAGPNGARIGICEITVNDKKITALSNRFVIPDHKTPEDDKYIRSLINEYLKSQNLTPVN
ncbi:MAG: hypothetical protein ACRCUT_04985 [Spirochaetota bacterium]